MKTLFRPPSSIRAFSRMKLSCALLTLPWLSIASHGNTPILEPPTQELFVLPGQTLEFEDAAVSTLAGADAGGKS